LDREFDHAFYAAEDDTWIVYNEPSATFLHLIGERDKLDSFIVEAPPPPPDSAIRIEAGSIERLVIGSDQKIMDFFGDVENVGDENIPSNRKRVKLVFNKEEAKVIFDVDPDDQDWLDHFLFDVNKHISSPSLLQKFGGFPLPLLFVGGGAVVIPMTQPHCRIILKHRLPNQRLVGIGDNIIASILYDILKIVIGVIIGGLLAAGLLSK